MKPVFKHLQSAASIFYSKLNYLTLLFVFIYTIAAVLVSVNRYWQYQSFYFDLGIFDMAIWRVAHFQLPLIDHIHINNKNVVIFADHFNPSIFLLSPLYWFTDRREILLVFQAVAVSASALMAYFIANKFLKNKLAVFSLILAYLGYIGLQNALITEFHEATIAPLPIMILFWAIFNNKWKLYFVCLLIILGLKESFAGFGVGIGLYMLISSKLKQGLIKTGSKKIWALSVITILISLIWGFVSIKVVIPYFSGGIYLYSPQAIPTNPGDFINAFLFPSLKLKTIFFTYLTFLFLPFFNVAIFPLVFENLLERFILSPYSSRWDLGFHYNAPLTPLMFIGALYVFILLERKGVLRRILAIILPMLMIFVVLILHRFILRGPLGLAYNGVFYEQNQRVKYVDNFLNQIPRDGLIMTQNDLAVRFTHNDVKLLRPNYRSIDPKYIVFNLTDGQNPNSFFPLPYEDVVKMKNELLKDKTYSLKKFGNEQYLFSKR